jgi:hypothetical protein
VNADLAVCGFTVVFNEASEDGRPADHREDYDPLASFAGTLPLRVDHCGIVTSSGVFDAGRATNFAIVQGEPPIPHGVLCLAFCNDDAIGYGVFDAVARGQLHSFSLGGNGRAEVSLTAKPAFTNCRVVGYGKAAISVWELLTGARPDIPGVQWIRAHRR